MTRLLAIAIAVFAGLASLAVGGCGDDPTTNYTMKSQYRPDVRTVCVPMWSRGKDVYRRGLEMRLTEAIVKRVQQDTPYRIASKDKADSVLEGTIEKVDQRVLSFNKDTGMPRELEILMTVSFKWTDLRTGNVLADRPSFKVNATYIPPAPFNEDFFQGSEDLTDRLSRRIVEQMEADW